MKQLEISGQTGKSVIMAGRRLKDIRRDLPGDARVIIITDRNVESLYSGHMPEAPCIVIGTGEDIKNLDTAAFIYRRLIEMEADRGVFLLGMGGGVVCDITGFVAATYLRGVRYANVPTTLLAQVDASVGGKTGVNFDGYKNMVGVFNQPEFVACDPLVLKTLPRSELSNGFAEIVKHAAIADSRYFQFLEDNADRLLELEPDLIERAVYDSVVVKAGIVNRDEREQGERRKLNFGHTLGHALEKTSGCAHGKAVSIGMAAAAGLSVKKGYLEAGAARRLEKLLAALGLPVSARFSPDEMFDALARDKKRRNESINFVFLSETGKAFVEPVALSELKQFLYELASFGMPT